MPPNRLVRDSIAAAQARADSIRRAQEAQQAMERQRRADSLAAIRAETEAVREMVARMVNFDFNRSNIRAGVDTEVLTQKIAILQANPNLRLEIVGHCDERGTDEYNMASRQPSCGVQQGIPHGSRHCRVTDNGQVQR